MQYDSYESKIAKIANFLKLLFKHKIKVLISLAFIMVTTVTLLATRGIIVKAEECPDSIYYGDKLDYSANAFLSKTHYEYRESGARSWSEKFPTFPGSYEVRAVSRATFGYKYGPVENFVILPKPITVDIANTDIVYGEDPRVSAELAKGDRIETVNFDFDNTSGEFKAKLEGLTIVNKAGENVTSCYAISTRSSKVTIRPRPITIEVESIERTYNGRPLYAKEYEITEGSLAEGNTSEIEVFGSRTDVGVSASGAEYRIFDANGDDVTEYYAVTVISGTVKVSPRKITLTSDSYTGLYDGESHSAMTTTMIGDIVEGQHVTLSGWTSITDTGEYDNTFDVAVLTADGDNVTSNYDVRVNFGKLKLLPRKITVTTGSGVFTYDGNYHNNYRYEISGDHGVAPSDYYDVGNFNDVIDFGEIENSCDVTLYNRSGYDVTHNYEITYEFGILKVDKRALRVVTGSASAMYSGAEITNYYLEYNGLIPDDYINVTDYTRAVNVGNYENRVEFTIFSGTRGCDVTDNYDITVTNGVLTVLVRPITVTTGTSTFVYNGEEQKDETVTVSGPYGLASGDHISITNATTIKNVGSATNILAINITNTDGEDVMVNYEITFRYGRLTVDKRPVGFVSESYDEIYDGKEHNLNGVEVIS